MSVAGGWSSARSPAELPRGRDKQGRRAGNSFRAGEDPRMAKSVYTGIIEKEGDVYVALCPELDVASQGATVEEREAVELFLEGASPEEIKQRLHTEVFVTRFEAAHG